MAVNDVSEEERKKAARERQTLFWPALVELNMNRSAPSNRPTIVVLMS